MSDWQQQEATAPDNLTAFDEQTALPVWIYALVDPRDYAPFYIGQTNAISRRCAAHIAVALRTPDPDAKDARIIALSDAGLKPIPYPLDQVPSEMALIVERAYISCALVLGRHLLNASLPRQHKHPLNEVWQIRIRSNIERLLGFS